MKAINLILDETGFFLEVQDDNGRPIKVGQHFYLDELHKIRITTADIDLAVPDLPAPPGEPGHTV